MTTASQSDLVQFAAWGVADAVSYVPGAQIAGTAPLYRLFSSNALDHMDSPLTNEGGYTKEGAVGFPWLNASAFPGLTQVMRQYRSWDHALTNAGDVLPGYGGTEYLGMYGYRRYGHTDTSFATLSAGSLTIRSNLVAGCSLWSWKWNNTEFVNVHDFGRQIQVAFGAQYNGVGVNPTEAGSTYSGPDLMPAVKQGAPCVSVSTVNGATASPIQKTRAIPLEWQPETLGGGSANPVAWPATQVGKDITLNYAGLGPVAQYTTVVTVPTASAAGIEIPSVYLTADLRTFFLYDAAANSLTPLPDPGSAGDGAIPPSGYGGLIVATSDGTKAFGIYGVTVANGGSVSPAPGGFSFFRFYPGDAGAGPSDNPTTKVRALNQAGLVAGENRFTTYLMSGSATGVRQLMRQLYLMGAR